MIQIRILDFANSTFSYPYPLFEQLDTTQRVVLFSLAALTMTGSTVMLQWFYGKVNSLDGAEKRRTPANIKGEWGWLSRDSLRTEIIALSSKKRQKNVKFSSRAKRLDVKHLNQTIEIDTLIHKTRVDKHLIPHISQFSKLQNIYPHAISPIMLKKWGFKFSLHPRITIHHSAQHLKSSRPRSLMYFYSPFPNSPLIMEPNNTA